MRLLATISSVLVLLAAPTMAQTGNPAGMTPGTGPLQPNNPDRLFVRTAAIGGMAEVEFGELAGQKGQSHAVKDFARRMIEDHGKANERLIGLAKEDGIAVPHELDAEHKAMRARLVEGPPGAEFDLAYVRGRWWITRKRCSSWNTRSARARMSSSRALLPRSCRSCSSTSALRRISRRS